VVGTTLAKGLEITAKNVASSAINAVSVRGLVTGGKAFDTDAFAKGAFGKEAMAGVVAGMAGNAVTSSANVGLMNKNLLGYSADKIGNVSSLTNTMGNLAAAGITYGMTGNVKLNVQKLFGVGVLEMNLGKDGFGMNFGMGGIDMNTGMLAGAMGGMNVLYQNHRIADFKKANQNLDADITMRALYSSGDKEARSLYSEVLSGKTKLVENKKLEANAEAQTTRENGQRVVTMRNLGGGLEGGILSAVVLQHEAYRDGYEGADQEAETKRAVDGHTGMAIRMANDGLYAGIIESNGGLAADIKNYMAGGDAFAKYVNANYDSSGDYWKLMEDGSLAYDGDGWLRDPNGNLILDKNGQKIGDDKVQKGLEKILNVSSNVASKMLTDSGFEDAGKGVYWTHDGNTGKSITLSNARYSQIYNSSLEKYNTFNIYQGLVQNGLMDYKLISGKSKGTKESWNGAQPDYEYISYKEYKANNFISGVSTDMVSLSQPVESDRISSPFGNRPNPFTGKSEIHTGIDWRVTEGTEVHPSTAGRVSFIGNTSYGGNTIILDHQMTYVYKGEEVTSTYKTDYMHLQSNPSGAANKAYSIGSTVSAFDTIGYSGNTGKSTGPHLHSGMYFNSFQSDPFANWLKLQGFTYTFRNERGYYFDPSKFY